MEKFTDIHFGGHLYCTKQIKKQNYNICYSDVIDDEYWNYAYLKESDVQLEKIMQDIKCEMKAINRKPVIYITTDILTNNLQNQVENANLQPLYTDVWMSMNNLNQFNKYISKIDFETHKVNKALKEKFIQAVMDGFAGGTPEEPYQPLSDGYRIALEKSFNENENKYKIIHYLGEIEKESICTATVLYGIDKAIIYNVTTNRKYQRQGVCKQLLSEIIEDLIALNIKEVCIQTEKGAYTEQVYKNIGFNEFLLGKAYIKGEK